MATDKDHAVSCQVCLKQVPADDAHSDEVNDYVYYFCGADCFDKWQHKSDEEKTDDSQNK